MQQEDGEDDRLAGLLAKLLEQQRHGEPVDVEQAAREHPSLAADLRQLWATAQLADELASHRGADDDSPDGAADGSPLSPVGVASPDAVGNLPRQLGDYELVAELGRGGMGVVYRAVQQSLGRVVALKMLLRGQIASAADLARFRAEAESAARLDHRNIVPIYDVGESGGQPFFTMQFVEGETLAVRLAHGPLPPREAAELLIPVCNAISEAHRRGILHRDLKPSNILIDDGGAPHVTDFGLAKQLEAGESLTRSGAIVGTPSYMAPEQAAGGRGRLGPASDVYSLGAILYHMLTGRPPFQGATAVDTVLMVLEQDVLPPRMLHRQVDLDLELIALKCLQKPPELRYASADNLARDLQAYLADEPIAARSSSFAQLLGRVLRDTHHAVVLENWGLLWMWHSLVVLVLCLLTNWMYWQQVTSPSPYLILWTLGFGTWAGMFWALRRRAGPITFVERQIAHVWAASVLGSTLLFVVEIILGLPVLTLSPVLALLGGTVFLVKAGILSGEFYFQAAALFVTSVVMARWPSVGVAIFGIVSAAAFFVPGLKWHRQRRSGLATSIRATPES